MMDVMPKTKKAISKKKVKQTTVDSPKKVVAKKVTVLKIVNGKPIDKKLSAEMAFSDPDQAKAQVCMLKDMGNEKKNNLSEWHFDNIRA
jgi:hypothetical protein